MNVLSFFPKRDNQDVIIDIVNTQNWSKLKVCTIERRRLIRPDFIFWQAYSTVITYSTYYCEMDLIARMIIKKKGGKEEENFF